MIRWLRDLWGRPDLDTFLNELSPYHPGGEYKAIDRFRDYRALFLSSPLGRKVLWDLLSMCRLYKPSMTTDPHKTAFNEGKRNVGLQILMAMNAEPMEPQQTTEKEERNG